jgi:putative inorganic carbon (HCO3(-)) transporter
MFLTHYGVYLIYRDIMRAHGSGKSAEAGLKAMPAREIASRSSFSLSFYSLTLFMLVYFLRPEDWIPSIQILPMAKITVIVCVIGFAVAGLRGDLTRPPREIGILALLFGQLSLAVLFSMWPGGSFDIVFGRFVKAVVMTSLISYAANTTSRLQRLLFIQAVSVTAVAVLAIAFYKAGRMRVTVGGNFGNPNDLAASLAIAFPLSFGFLLQAPTNLRRLCWLASMGILIYGILLTSSRGGFLMLVAASLVCLWSFGVQGRRWWLLLVPLIALAGFSVLPPEWISTTTLNHY